MGQSIRIKIVATFVLLTLPLLLFGVFAGFEAGRETRRLDETLANNAAINQAATST